MPRVEYYIDQRMGFNTNGNAPYHGGHKANRENLAKLFYDLHYTKGAEIGVCCGDYSKMLCENNPDLELLSIDSWTLYTWERSIEHAELCYQQTIEKLRPYKATIIRKDSIEASKDIPNGSLDFVYIDADHTFDCVMLDLIYWAPKVRRRGIVAGHDYMNYRKFGVKTAVDTYIQMHGNPPLYITKAAKSDPPSWFWVQI